ncbi:MAG: PilZ domain-containing protein [Marinobacter sp.]|uniref:PilZ domain-containing protein n=1 Tax=Marinobacter sp. TaxID=50741 RepID=UPI00299E6886|nr:PilZ domain-containing protein [Marinobacter sp.]MDX1635645.1 PilZ domain-containing protein [Marinobacter sp.]
MVAGKMDSAHKPDVTRWNGKDRRESYRVNDRVALRYRRLHGDHDMASESARLSLQSRLASLQQALDDELARLAESAPATHRIARLLNDKMDCLMDTMALDDSQSSDGLVSRHINLSAGGLAFVSEDTLLPGERLLLDLLWHPGGDHIRAIARVVSANRESGGCRVRADFESLPNHDRETLMRHILEVQSRSLRERRAAGGETAG